MDIREIIDRIYRMPESSAVRLAACMSSLSRPRGYCVLEAGRVEPNLFFIGRGIARACISADGKKVTFWIGAEGSALVSLKSYVDDEPGYETIELMEESLLYVLKRSDLERFLAEDIHIANWAGGSPLSCFASGGSFPNGTEKRKPEFGLPFGRSVLRLFQPSANGGDRLFAHRLGQGGDARAV